MSRPRTLPTLFDEVHFLSISKLKECEFLNPNQKLKKATLTWSRNGKKSASLTIQIYTDFDSGYIEFEYNYKDEPRKYKVALETITSNIGKGLVWYFVCPQTLKRCRKLYLIDGYLLHREAFKCCMYESQTFSHRDRDTLRFLDPYFKKSQYYEQLYKKYFKKFYAGKPTKRYLHLMKQIEKAKSITSSQIESAMMI